MIPTVPQKLFSDVRSHNFFLSLWTPKIASEEARRLSVIAPRQAFLSSTEDLKSYKDGNCILVVVVALFQKELLPTVVPSGEMVRTHPNPGHFESGTSASSGSAVKTLTVLCGLFPMRT